MTDFDFKPLNEGLGFHRDSKKNSDVESDNSEDTFSFSSLGAPLGQSSHSSDFTASDSYGVFGGSGLADPETSLSLHPSQISKAKIRHNSKGVSDLIASLPPAFDFLDERDRGSSTSRAAKSPLTSNSAPAATAGSAAPMASTISSTVLSTTATAPASSPGFLKMPLGRDDYRKGAGALGSSSVGSANVSAAISAAAQAVSQSSVDENLAKLSRAFPHLGRLAGQPAAQTLRDAQTAQTKATATSGTHEKPLAFHFGSAILDTLVVLGVGCVLLAILLGVTGANLVALLENSRTDVQTMILLGVLFFAAALLYTLASRSFLGATLGEWSYEIRVGSKDARSRWYYPLLVLWRGALVSMTGFVLFPLISAVFGRDVLKWLTGIELVTLES